MFFFREHELLCLVGNLNFFAREQTLDIDEHQFKVDTYFLNTARINSSQTTNFIKQLIQFVKLSIPAQYLLH